MNCLKLLLVLAFVSLAFAEPIEFSEENTLLMKRGFKDLRKCIKSKEVTSDPDVLAFLDALKNQNYEMVAKYFGILLKRRHTVIHDCLGESNGVNWNAVIECLYGLGQAGPCIVAAIGAAVAQCYLCVPGALAMCGAGAYVDLITGCFQRFW